VLLLGYFRWLIEAAAGRRVNLTLYDFTSMTSSTSRGHDVIRGVSGSSSSSFCRRLAVVRDLKTGRETNVCSGSRRVRHAYVSDGSRVEITMATAVNTATNMASDVSTAHFLIRYEGWRIIIIIIIISVRRRRLNIDSSSKSNPLRHRRKIYKKSTNIF